MKKTIHSLCLALLAGTALVLGGCASEEVGSAPRAVEIEGLYPSFDPGERRYVSRCGRGDEPIRAEARKGAKVAVGSGPRRSGEVEIAPGARPNEDFAIRVFDGGDRQTYRVRCLPADFPDWQFESLRQADPGLFVVSFRATREERPWVIVFDHEGAPRWWYSPPTRALWGQVLSDGTVTWARSFGDGYGLDPRMAHEVRSLSGKLLRLIRTRGPIVDGHELQALPGGRFLLASYAPEARNLTSIGGPARAAVVAAEIQEIGPRGRLLWRWSSRGRIRLAETGRWWRNVLSNPRRRLGGLAAFDPVHINSIDPHGKGQVVISTRHTDAVYGIDRQTGEIAWKLGGTETAESLRVVGDPAHKTFGGQHDARVSADGTLSVYDNGKDRPRLPRVAFYRLEPERGHARYVGQLNDATVKTSHCCGSARPTEGGGWLVSWGDNPLVTGFDAQGRIAFRLKLAASTFRAVPVPPGAASVARLDRGMEAMESKLRPPTPHDNCLVDRKVLPYRRRMKATFVMASNLTVTLMTMRSFADRAAATAAPSEPLRGI